MPKKTSVDKLEKHLQIKRNELVFALSLQHYTAAQIGRMFNMNRSTALRILRTMPRDWKPKWEKVKEE